jgi:sarcosine oxidase subunit gamma
VTADLARRSPLGATGADPQVVASADGVHVAERPFLAQILLRMPRMDAATAALDLPTKPNGLTVRPDDGRLAIWLGPDECLIVGRDDADTLEAAVRSATANDGGTTSDVSAHRTWLEFVGPGVPDLLSAGSSVDWHPRVFEVGHAAQTQLARVDVIVGRTGEQTYIVAVRTSFARYLLDWIKDALED